MSQLELTKMNIVRQLRQLCAHCQSNPHMPHNCKVRDIALRVQAIQGVPLIVNDEFRGILNMSYQ